MSGATGSIHVLHVDDEPEFVDLVATFLERQDERVSVERAASATRGLDHLEADEVDCVVSDYEMPGRNGIEFLEAVRAIRPELPFILFTGKGSEEVASDAISAGVTDYLQKEPGTDQYAVLANRLINAVERYRAETGLRNRIRQQEIVAELGQSALAETELDVLFEQAVGSVADALDNPYAKVLDYRPADDNLLLRAGVGWREGLAGEATVGAGLDSQAGYTLQSEEPVIVEDLRTEERFGGPPLLVEHDVVSGISVIIGTPEHPWGVFGTHTVDRRRFTDDDIQFVQGVANVLANAIRRHELERELGNRNERLEEFASIVSHDLRNPLTVAEGRLELAREEHDSDDLAAVSRAHERMRMLIDDLLSVAREGGGATDPQPVALADIVEQCWRNVDTRSATLEGEPTRTIRADPRRLQQLFENLFRNAVEHGGSDVTVRTGVLEDGFFVEDDGGGIPEPEREHVFDVGYSTLDEGNGFGLSIVRRIVRAHDWQIEVAEASGGGVRFEVRDVDVGR